MKKIFTATLAGTLAATLAVCGGPVTSILAQASTEEESYEGVTLSMMDWGDSVQAVREKFNEQFIAEHPGLKIEYQVLTTDNFNQNIASLVGSGDAPDIFYVPTTMTLAQVVSEGWLKDMTEYYTEDFLNSIDPTAYSQGIGSVDGVLYGINIVAPCNNMLLFYNKDLVKEVPKTYSEFIEVCKQVTEAGDGDVYGYVDGFMQAARLDSLQRGLTGMAGGLDQGSAANFHMSTTDGAYVATEQSKQAAEFLADLYEAGVMHPDSATMNAPQAREYFGSGKAAFICQGNWCISAWLKDHPDLNYGVCALPVPDGYTGTSSVFKVNGGNVMVVSATSEHPELAAEYIMELNSMDSVFVSEGVATGSLVSTVIGANEKYITDEHLKEYMQLDEELGIFVPQAVNYSSEANKLVAAVQSVSPDLGTITQGIVTGAIKKSEIGSYLDMLNEALLAEWQRAADAAGVTTECITFDDWKIGEDYEGR